MHFTRHYCFSVLHSCCVNYKCIRFSPNAKQWLLKYRIKDHSRLSEETCKRTISEILSHALAIPTTLHRKRAIQVMWGRCTLASQGCFRFCYQCGMDGWVEKAKRVVGMRKRRDILVAANMLPQAMAKVQMSGTLWNGTLLCKPHTSTTGTPSYLRSWFDRPYRHRQARASRSAGIRSHSRRSCPWRISVRLSWCTRCRHDRTPCGMGGERRKVLTAACKLLLCGGFQEHFGSALSLMKSYLHRIGGENPK